MKQKGEIRVPMVVRMIGTNEEEGRRICKSEGIPVLDAMDAAAEMAVKLVRGVS
jgi:succinyl-CoA synthetase beta subunit